MPQTAFQIYVLQTDGIIGKTVKSINELRLIPQHISYQMY